MALVPDTLWVIANMKKTQMADVRIGQPVTFTVDALNHLKLYGHVQQISPATGSSSPCCRPTMPPATSSRSPSASRCALPSTPSSLTSHVCVPACRWWSALIHEQNNDAACLGPLQAPSGVKT